MNAHSKIEHETLVNMTSKGQVLIPKVVRDLNGLIPNGPVRVGINDRGETVILPPEDGNGATPEQRRTRFRQALEKVRGTIDLQGLTTDEYLRELRGDWEP